MRPLRDVPVQINIDPGVSEENLILDEGWTAELGPNERMVWKALCALNDRGEVTMGAIADVAGISPNAAKNTLYGLQRRGFISGMPFND